MLRVALEYTVTLWACTARRAFAAFRGLLALLPQVGLVQCQVAQCQVVQCQVVQCQVAQCQVAQCQVVQCQVAQCQVADSSKERVLVVQEPQVAVTWRLRRLT